MKKRILTIVAVVALVVSLSIALVACSNGLIAVSKQVDLIRELRSKTIDIGIMDKAMAESYCKDENNKDLMMIEGLVVQEELYGVGLKKGNKALLDKINVALVELFNEGEIARLANDYGIVDQLKDSMEYTSVWETLTEADKADYNALMSKGKVVIGMTLYAPMANSMTEGFDIELPILAFKKIGLNVEFKEITWQNKFIELNSGTIDVIWNGMTITDEVNKNTECSISYLSNRQVAVILKENKDIYTKDMTTFKGARIGAEGGSSGEKAYKDVIKPLIKK